VTGVIDVAAVDDHPLVLDSMAGWVMGAEGGIRVVGTAPTVGDLLAGPGRAADVVLLDLDLDDGSTVERNVADILAAGPVVLVREKYARAGRAAPTKLDLYHRAVEDGHLLPPP
jgi:two-component system, NarL family, nitrate/nitrite response regulator NarL